MYDKKAYNIEKRWPRVKLLLADINHHIINLMENMVIMETHILQQVWRITVLPVQVQSATRRAGGERSQRDYLH